MLEGWRRGSGIVACKLEVVGGLGHRRGNGAQQVFAVPPAPLSYLSVLGHVAARRLTRTPAQVSPTGASATAGCMAHTSSIHPQGIYKLCCSTARSVSSTATVLQLSALKLSINRKRPTAGHHK